MDRDRRRKSSRVTAQEWLNLLDDDTESEEKPCTIIAKKPAQMTTPRTSPHHNLLATYNDEELADDSKHTQAQGGHSSVGYGTNTPHRFTHSSPGDVIDLTGVDDLENQDITPQSQRSNTLDVEEDDDTPTDIQPSTLQDSPLRETYHLPLDELPYEARVQRYNEHYEVNLVRLSTLKIPPVCKQYPRFADEILVSSLARSKFMAEVWVNYDAVEQKFYNDSRIELCGKIRIPLSSRSTLQGWDRGMANFIFELSTAFTTLGWVFIYTTYDQRVLTRAKLKVDKKCMEHMQLRHFLISATRQISLRLQDMKQNSFSLHDIDGLAESFVCQPLFDPYRRQPLYDFIPVIRGFGEGAQTHMW